MDLTQAENAKTLLTSSKTQAEWDANCNKVKAANRGYPSWWYATIVQPNLHRLTITAGQK